MCCLKDCLLLFNAELYSTCSSSHGFHSSVRNGATPPSLTPPANAVTNLRLTFNGKHFRDMTFYKSDTIALTGNVIFFSDASHQ